MNKESLTALFKTSILLGALLSTSAFAQSRDMAGCDPVFMQKAEQIQQQEVIEAAQHAEDIWTGHTEQPPWMQQTDGLLTACANNNWPYANVASPILNLLVDGSQQRAVREACNRARNAIAEGTGKYYETLATIDNYKAIAQDMMSGDADWLNYWNQVNDRWGIIDGLPGIDLPPDMQVIPGWGTGGGNNGGIISLPGFSPPPNYGTPGVVQPGQQPPTTGIPGVTP